MILRRENIMKKKIIIILCILFIICLCVTSYYNLIHPIKLVSVNVECINWDATYVGLEAFENNYNNGEYNKDKTLIHNFDGKLPSDNPNDYMDVYINLEFENRNLFQAYDVDGYISNFKNNKEMPIYSNIMSDVERVFIFRKSEKTGSIVATLYIADKTDEEVMNMVRGIELKFVANGDYFGKQELEIDLSNVDDITVER